MYEDMVLQLHINKQKIKLNPYLTPYTKTNSKMDQRPKYER